MTRTDANSLCIRLAGSTDVQGKLTRGCPFMLMIGGRPRYRIPTNHKVMTYPSEVPLFRENPFKAVAYLQRAIFFCFVWRCSKKSICSENCSVHLWLFMCQVLVHRHQSAHIVSGNGMMVCVPSVAGVLPALPESTRTVG